MRHALWVIVFGAMALASGCAGMGDLTRSSTCASWASASSDDKRAYVRSEGYESDAGLRVQELDGLCLDVGDDTLLADLEDDHKLSDLDGSELGQLRDCGDDRTHEDCTPREPLAGADLEASAAESRRDLEEKTADGDFDGNGENDCGETALGWGLADVVWGQCDGDTARSLGRRKRACERAVGDEGEQKPRTRARADCLATPEKLGA